MKYRGTWRLCLVVYSNRYGTRYILAFFAIRLYEVVIHLFGEVRCSCTCRACVVFNHVVGACSMLRSSSLISSLILLQACYSCLYIYIYIYIYNVCLRVCVCVYIYIYIVSYSVKVISDA